LTPKPENGDDWPKGPWRPWSEKFDWVLHKKFPKFFKPAHYYESLVYYHKRDAEENQKSSIGSCGISTQALIAYDFVTVSQFNSFMNSLEKLEWHDAYRRERSSLQWLRTRTGKSNLSDGGCHVILNAVQKGDGKLLTTNETRLNLPHWCERARITAIKVNPALIALRFTFSFRGHYKNDLEHLAKKSHKTELAILPKGGWEIREPKSQKKRSIFNKRKAWKNDIENFIKSHLTLELSNNSAAGVPIFEICELHNLVPTEDYDTPSANLMEIMDISWNRHRAWIYDDLEGFVLYPSVDNFDAQGMLYSVITANSDVAEKTMTSSIGRRMTGWTISTSYSKALLGYSIDHLLRHYNSVLVKMRDDLSETSGLRKSVKSLKNASIQNRRREDIEAIIGDFSKSKNLENFRIRSENLSPLESEYFTDNFTMKDFLTQNISARIEILRDLDKRYEKQLLSRSNLVSAWASLSLSRAVLFVGLITIFLTIMTNWNDTYSKVWLNIINLFRAN